MHSAIPALESLDHGWETQAKKPPWVEFEPVLNAGITKISEYYDKITDSDTYIFCMCTFIQAVYLCSIIHSLVVLVLDPSQKLVYFGKHWSSELQAEVLVMVEKIVSQLSLYINLI